MARGGTLHRLWWSPCLASRFRPIRQIGEKAPRAGPFSPIGASLSLVSDAIAMPVDQVRPPWERAAAAAADTVFPADRDARGPAA